MNIHSTHIIGKLGIKPSTKKTVLEKINKYMFGYEEMLHIVSINPENIVEAQKNDEFRTILELSGIQLIDGVGVSMALGLKGISEFDRITGVDLFQELLENIGKGRSSALLIGGKQGLAEGIAQCYSKKFPHALYLGTTGFADVRHPAEDEKKAIFSIVVARKPRFLFVAFGSPEQESWIWSNRKLFQGMICMGVGGGFDFVSGSVQRAPNLLRRLGLEWLFRLFTQPWRWKRQTRLLEFIWLVATEGLKKN